MEAFVHVLEALVHLVDQVFQAFVYGLEAVVHRLEALFHQQALVLDRLFDPEQPFAQAEIIARYRLRRPLQPTG